VSEVVSTAREKARVRRKPAVPVTVVDAEPISVIWHEPTVHISDLLNELHSIYEELVAIRELLEKKKKKKKKRS